MPPTARRHVTVIPPTSAGREIRMVLAHRNTISPGNQASPGASRHGERFVAGSWGQGPEPRLQRRPQDQPLIVECRPARLTSGTRRVRLRSAGQAFRTAARSAFSSAVRRAYSVVPCRTLASNRWIAEAAARSRILCSEEGTMRPAASCSRAVRPSAAESPSRRLEVPRPAAAACVSRSVTSTSAGRWARPPCRPVSA